jgi:hypothetical protein
VRSQSAWRRRVVPKHIAGITIMVTATITITGTTVIGTMARTS